MDKLNIEIVCPSCGCEEFEFPTNFSTDDAITCIGCDTVIEGVFQNEVIRTDKILESSAKIARDIFKRFN